MTKNQERPNSNPVIAVLCKTPAEAIQAVDGTRLIPIMKTGNADALDEILWAFFPSITSFLERNGLAIFDSNVFTTLRRRLRNIVHSRPKSLLWNNGAQAWVYLKAASINIALDAKERTVKTTSRDPSTLSKTEPTFSHQAPSSLLDLHGPSCQPEEDQPDLGEALQSVTRAFDDPNLSKVDLDYFAHHQLEQVLQGPIGSSILVALTGEPAINILVILARATHPDWTDRERHEEFIKHHSVASVRTRMSRILPRIRRRFNEECEKSHQTDWKHGFLDEFAPYISCPHCRSRRDHAKDHNSSPRSPERSEEQIHQD